METLEQPDSASPGTKPDLNLLEDRKRADDGRRWRSSAVVSIAVHVVAVTALLLMPGEPGPARAAGRATVGPRDAGLRAYRSDADSSEQRTRQQGDHRGGDRAAAADQVAVARARCGPTCVSPHAATPPPPAAPPPVVAPAPPKPIIVEPPKVQADTTHRRPPRLRRSSPPLPRPPPLLSCLCKIRLRRQIPRRGDHPARRLRYRTPRCRRRSGI